MLLGSLCIKAGRSDMVRRVPEAADVACGLVPSSELAEITRTVRAQLKQANANLRFAQAALAADSGTACWHASAAEPSPATNRGVNVEETRQVIAARLVLEDGQILEIPARRTWGGSSAFLDWVNFTTDENDYFFGKACVSDEDVMDRISFRCSEIFGFGITQQRETGANFYHRSYVLGDGYGVVCHGGQRATVLVMLSGEGCSAAKEGWEKRLYEFLTVTCGGRAKLTRVDLAHDVYDGKAYSVDRADADFDAGLFKQSHSGGRMPNHEYRGNWKRPTGKGRTLYIGNRESGKFCRVYEKGRQLGDKNSEWVRVEVEMKAVHRQIPFEVLLEPGQYLAATYPAFGWISEHQERILTTQKKTEITYQSMCDYAKKQFGAVLNVLVAIEGSAEKAVRKVIRDEIPTRMKVPMWQTVGECLHEWAKVQPSREVFDAMALA